jgi:hypothetical protein
VVKVREKDKPPGKLRGSFKTINLDLFYEIRWREFTVGAQKGWNFYKLWMKPSSIYEKRYILDPGTTNFKLVVYVIVPYYS